MGKNILCTIVTKKRKKKRGFCMELALEIFLLYLLTYNMRRICHPGKWFTDDSRKVWFTQTHWTIRATWDDSRNSMDVSRKQAAMLCFFQIKI